MLTGYIPFGIVSLSYGQTINDLTGRNDSVTPGTIGAGQVQRFGRTGDASNQAHSIYFQDRWQPTARLSINGGVRFEKENLPSFNSFAPPINFGWGDKIVPRLGFAYDLTGNGKTKLFASFGQFTDRLKFELPRGSFGGEFFRVDYFEISPANPNYDYYTLARILGNNTDVLNGKCPINNPSGLTRCQYDFRIASNTPGASIEDGKVDPNLKPFRQTEFTAGFERELSRNYLLSIRYSYKNLNDAIEDAGFPNAAGSEAYIIGNPGKGLHAETAKAAGYAKTTTPQRRYDALEIKLDRRFSSNYYFQAAYTYSRLYGNYSGLASSDEGGRTSPGVNRFFDLPHLGFTADGKPDNGRLATDRPHVANLYGAYNFKWFGAVKGQETQFGLFTTAQSGSPITSFYTLYAAAILSGRGNLGRTPVFTNTDFSVSHRYRFGNNERLGLVFDFNVLNIFNEANVLTVSANPGALNPSISTLG
ncbi:MAG: TonB-dependent receptor domain-containing protein, partial [Blastocatellia bacterium]